MVQDQTDTAKWERYYQGEAPWDTGRPASQLVELLPRLATLCHSMRENKAPRALELGCGTGASCCYLAEQGYNVVGIDVVQAALDQAEKQREQLQERSSAAAERLSFKCQDFWELEDATDVHGTYDFIFDCQLYHTVAPEARARLVDLYQRLLQPGGVLCMLTGNANEAEVGPATVSREELTLDCGPFAAASWEQVELCETRFDPTPAYDRLERCPLAWQAIFRRLPSRPDPAPDRAQLVAQLE
ncbi:uncharacterized protein MONBRDRAFT_36597 [Monosiga brevicollis MX1]|uniref:Methyltransferase domain-containing protein n=1 Tax=Monosiga brevicollis TaxID=81824 RepID=A9UWC2_MONBE|nr:uncharacterized protein MONBRDRAFT_36597 [Monosiga brevicollis MX1]EDQ90537.1 predicted protein [Monosiga brevicollis MX1]|eukprot:XP_001744588.1 hypothetical protein [Monosiga brevicollis MX1]